MILLWRNADNSLHIGKFRLCKRTEKNCSEAGLYYSGPAQKKPLARSQKNRLNLENTRRRAEKKRRFCHQKPAATAQYPSPHPTRDHANTPRQQQTAPCKALSVARRGKKPRTLSKTPKMPRSPPKIPRRPAAMWQYNSLLCPQKSGSLSGSYVFYKE